MRRNRRRLGIAATLCAAAFLVSQTACFGSFGLTTALWRFNKEVHPNKWIQWLIFLAFAILPVYEIAALVDVLIINSIEFWTGKEVVGGGGGGGGGGGDGGDGAAAVGGERVIPVAGGLEVRMRRTGPDTMSVALWQDGALTGVRTFRRGADGVSVEDAAGHVVMEVRPDGRGGAVLLAEGGREAARVSAAQVEQAADALAAGGPAALVQVARDHVPVTALPALACR